MVCAGTYQSMRAGCLISTDAAFLVHCYLTCNPFERGCFPGPMAEDVGTDDLAVFVCLRDEYSAGDIGCIQVEINDVVPLLDLPLFVRIRWGARAWYVMLKAISEMIELIG